MPTPQELTNCRPYLESEIRLLSRVRVVVTLGHVAYQSWLQAAGGWHQLGLRDRPRFGHGVDLRLPDGRVILSSYHPSRQNTNTGRLTRTMWHGVFRRARECVESG
jgi:uracil-DNA glycosylase